MFRLRTVCPSQLSIRCIAVFYLMSGLLPVSRADFPDPDAANLPPRTLIVAPPRRDVPQWIKTNVRIGHLPGYNERMVSEFLKAGYNVVTVNCLGNWDRVGPAARLYSPDDVARADAYL